MRQHVPRYFPAREILTNVWVGSQGDALSNEFFRKHSIRYVINVSKTIPFNPDHPELDGLRIPVNDDPSENDNMLNYLPLAVKCVVSAMTNDTTHGCLVHCLAGQQRSCTVAAAVLIKQHKMTPKQAIQYIQKLKPEAFSPKATFARALDDYHELITSLN
jgi:protein-tyrosine phosphatase